MGKIITPEQAVEIAQQLRNQGIKLVLAGGCFDILHFAHIKFLNKAKKEGDCLMLLLESDSRISKIKGNDRPINNQKQRAQILAALPTVNYIVMLNEMPNNNSYDRLISQLKPAIIATTAGDTGRKHKERQAQLTGAKVVDVIKRIDGISTSKLLSEIKK